MNLSLFEKMLSVSEQDIAFELRGISSAPWSEFILNPRRLRGSDFLMRWSQGAWSERRIVEAVNSTKEFFALEYGPSGTAPDNDVRAYELYFERLEHAGLGEMKRPDILIFPATKKKRIDRLVKSLGGKEELPFIPEKDLGEILSHTLLAIECENSLWKSKAMPDYGQPLTAQKRLDGKPGLKKTAVVPTVIIKEEDRGPLQKWQQSQNIKIHIWHVFFDQAYGLSLDEADRLVKRGLIEPTIQTFQAPGGATTRKVIYKFYYHYAYPLAESTEPPTLEAASIEDKNGHILPYVVFKNGKFRLTKESLNILRKKL